MEFVDASLFSSPLGWPRFLPSILGELEHESECTSLSASQKEVLGLEMVTLDSVRGWVGSVVACMISLTGVKVFMMIYFKL